MIEFSHSQLVEIAYGWVLNNTSCGIAVKEISAYSECNEIPDVIGFGSGCHSILIECKTSRNDYLADKKKFFRQFPEKGMGSQRFYLAPKGLIKVEELPEKWGLIEISEKGKAKCVHKNYTGYEQENQFVKNIKAEHSLMYSLLRRLHIRDRLKEVYEGIPEVKIKK